MQDNDDYPFEDDEWMFKPGGLVRCVIVTKDNAKDFKMAEDWFEEGKSILFAKEKVEG